MLVSKFGKLSFKLFVDCGLIMLFVLSYGYKKIEFIKLRGNAIILSKIKKNIAKKNRVLLNPSFNIVDLSEIEKYIKSK